MAHDVFISYSSKDKPIADAICAHIEAAGVRCWIAPRDIKPGTDWPTAISQAIAEGRVLVLIFSAHSNASEDVSRELYLAANHQLVIIPFKIENIEPEAGKQYYLARTHWLEAINPPTKEQIQKLVERVRTLVPLKGPASPDDEIQSRSLSGTALPAEQGTQSFEKRRTSQWLWSIPVVVLLFGLLAWFAFSQSKKRSMTISQATQPSLPSAVTTLPMDTQAITVAPTLPIDTHDIAQDATGTPPAEPTALAFTRNHISETFEDNALDWPVGGSTDGNWVGDLTITDGILQWEGTAVSRMNALIHPGLASLQDDLSDQEVSTRFNLVSQDTKGAYGLYLRASQDGSSFYAFYVLNDAFGFMKLTGENQWKALTGWETSPAVRGEGWIKMSVQATGSHFRLFVNDELLTELDDTSLSSGQSGLLVTAYTEDMKIQAQFDDFTVLLPSP